ncbi:MAG: DUF1294 domain-containing protein [Ruminococcaceae bacterium]|nr:DUF1294 domain-containing protein [Oscillospiraceae bacterium]
MFPQLLIIYLVLVNAAAFLLMLADKLKAKKGAWRIPERTLIGIAVIGGSIGAITGMNLFRHKTRHLKFSIGLPVILAVQVVLGLLVYLHV